MKENTGDPKVLERFMKEHFHYPSLKEAGFFTKEMKGDYEAQAKRVCEWFGYSTVYEYNTTETRCHFSLSNPKETDQFVTVTIPWTES